MHRITKYTVAATAYKTTAESAIYQTELEAKVNALIEKGWQPFGSLQLVQRADTLIALQPMVRLDGNGTAAATPRDAKAAEST
jgi:hypothetical protein